jgi:hypothetical protein
MTEPYVDTSALAKWYLNEDFSDAVEDYLRGFPSVQISSLTRIEFRCLLARRRRNRELSADLESKVSGSFQEDIQQGHLRVLPLEDEHVETAMAIMDSLPEHALRALDALHLALTRTAGLKSLATADRIMAAAAEALGLSVKKFFPGAEAGVTLDDSGRNR